MKKDTLAISKSLLIKALLLSFILLTLTFGLGLVIGKTDDSLQNMTSADEGEIREQLSDCSFKLQEITAKHLSLIKSAKQSGLMDGNGRIVNNIVCTALNSAKSASENAEQGKTTEVKKDKVKEKKKETADEKELEKKKPEKEKKPLPKKLVKACSFSIQLFSDPDKEKAKKAKTSYPFKGLRLIEAEIRGRSWYRIRYGCYATRAEAELDLPEVKDVIDSAIVVAD